MPELPEVETVRGALATRLTGRRFIGARLYARALRWPLPVELNRHLADRHVTAVARRAKYLLVSTRHATEAPGVLLMHLGMTGVVSVLPAATQRVIHDHVDMLLDDEYTLRFHDPRRFGAILWINGATGITDARHALLDHLGPEPLGSDFTGEYLASVARGRRAPIKTFIMDQSVVVGVGNIYASEALFRAGIHPKREAGRVSRPRLIKLVAAIKQTLAAAIAAGGTTLRDYRLPDGDTGNFQNHTQVYARDGLPCVACGHVVRLTRQAGRATYYCAVCQR